MAIKTSFGVVVLLDALGARTTDMKVSRSYLKNIHSLQDTCSFLKTIPLRIAQEDGKKLNIKFAKDISEHLVFRYFGDSILITYSIASKRNVKNAIKWVAIITCLYICAALKKGILMRGSFAIGSYIESETAILGPAITDAANWYEQIDMIGVILTPGSANFLKAAWHNTIRKSEAGEEKPTPPFVLYDIPLSRGESQNIWIRTYALDWPNYALFGCTKAEKRDKLLWYLNRVRLMQVAKGSEKKYSNTEAFVSKSNKIQVSGLKIESKI